MKQVWKRYQPNPCGKSVGDCAVRAISAALGVDWYEAYDLLCDEGRKRCNMPSGDEIWGAVLEQFGFRKYAVNNQRAGRYTAQKFCIDHPSGIYTLALGGHVATVVQGELMDSWNSSAETIIYYYARRF